MPLPRKTMPKRLGKADGGGTSAKACSDSSQGKATVQPAPRSTARREMGRVNFLVSRDMKLLPRRLKPHVFASVYLRRVCEYPVKRTVVPSLRFASYRC